MNKQKDTTKKENIYNEYRKVLERPDLSRNEVEAVRQNLKLIATTICEHVWKKIFY